MTKGAESRGILYRENVANKTQETILAVLLLEHLHFLEHNRLRNIICAVDDKEMVNG